MVRTYAFNASSRSEIFEQYKHTAAAPRFNPDSHNTSRSQDTVPSSYINDSRRFQPSDSQSLSNSTTNSLSDNSSQMSNQENNNQYMSPVFPPIHQSNIYQSSFHSSMLDPMNSIVALRPIYMNGQLVYMPVEPHINMMINQQFGGMKNQVQPNTTSQIVLPQIQPNMPVLAQNGAQAYSESPSQLARSQSKQDVYPNQIRQDPYSQANISRQSANQQYRQNTINAKYGSLPNLATQKPGQEQYKLSSQEQHKLELQQQIEDNKRRKALEKQKEIELEQREIRKWEEYQKRIQEEDNREKRQIQEKARAIELRNQQVYEKQKQPQYQRNERRPPREREISQQRQQLQQQQDYYDSYDEEEQHQPSRHRQQNNMRNSNSFSSEYSEQQQAPPRSIRNQARYEQQYNVVREQRPDSSQPREVEWWEKKQPNKAVTPQSAVIPTLRGKPPAVPDSQRSGYDSSGNVGEHQSRPSSRTTSSTQRSSDTQSQEPVVDRSSSKQRNPPTAFTIAA